MRLISLLFALFTSASLLLGQANTYPWLSSGDVGIGTANPQAKLHISSGASGAQLSNPGLIVESATHEYITLASAANTQRALLFSNPTAVNYAGISWEDGTRGNTMQFLTATQARMVIDSGGGVGIGTTSPQARLHISSGASGALLSNPGLIVESATHEYITLASAANTQRALLFSNPTAVNYAGISWEDGTRGNTMQFLTAAQARMVIDNNGNVGIGTATPTQKLSVNGSIRAKEVIVDTGWADYVFADDYKLKPLSEVEQQIKAEKHLPGIPSAADVAEKGISVGEMQAKLLAKIEELTLHVIEQEKELREQKEQAVSRDQQLLRRIEQLEGETKK
jgi:hypothetical protein